MMGTGLFQKLTGFYAAVNKVKCRGILSSGEFVEMQFEGCYTWMRVCWLYDYSICLSSFYKTKGRDEYAHLFDLNVVPHEEQIVEWCRRVVDGKYAWREYDHPGLATVHALPFATAIKEAMTEVGETFAEPEEFKHHVLAKIRNASKWTLNDRKFLCQTEEEPPATVTLVIANPTNLDLRGNTFADHTIVYAPESPGRYFLYALDDEDGKRNVRTIVDGWLNDLEESEYLPFA